MKHEGGCCFQPCLTVFSFPSVVNCWLSGVGFGYRMFLSMVVVVCCWLSGIVYWALAVDCRVSLSVFFVGSWSSGVGCRVLALDCRCRL